jgi:hypothetical protein
MLMSATLYQVLHFRHVWALLGVVAAVDLWGRRDSGRRNRKPNRPLTDTATSR